MSLDMTMVVMMQIFLTQMTDTLTSQKKGQAFIRMNLWTDTTMDIMNAQMAATLMALEAAMSQKQMKGKTMTDNQVAVV
jgi:hypothetical protein